MKSAPETLNIRIHKIRILLFTLSSIVFGVTCYLFLVLTDFDSKFSNATLSILCGAGILVSFIGLLGFPIGLFMFRPILVIDENGVLQHIGNKKGKFVPWEQITGFEIDKVNQMKILYIHIDPDQNVNWTKSSMQGLLKYRLDPDTTRISIPLVFVQYKPLNLIIYLRNRLEVFQSEH